MDDEQEKPEGSYPLARSGAKMSKTPSWVMLGFILGALFVYAMMRRAGPAAPSSVSVRIVDAPKPAVAREAAPLTTIEAVFAVWWEQAVWFEDTTEVALWNPKENVYGDYFEVRRISGVYYFRSIPELTRRIIRRGREMPDSPLQFTETEEQYREWLEHGRTERRVERDLRPIPAPQPAAPAAPRAVPKQTAPPPLPETIIQLRPGAKK